MLDRLLAYLALLQRWNATYNLTAVRDPGEMLTQHLPIASPSSARCVDSWGRHVAPHPRCRQRRWSAGVVLAVLEPGWAVTCVDAVGKKAAFIRQVAVELRLRNLAAEHARVESLKAGGFDLITSRAFASLADFVSLTRKLLAPRACGRP